MAETLRYARSEDVLRLAMKMAGNRQGLSLADIQEEFEIGRRTAERMRDAVLRLFPDTVEHTEDGRIKRWYIPQQSVQSLVSLTSDDLSALHMAAKLAQTENLNDVAERLFSISDKLKLAIESKKLGRIEPDLEALIEAEGLAIRQGPHPVINRQHLDALRYAIKGCLQVELNYTFRSTGKTGRQRVQPYGFLYGSRHYLVAYSLEQEGFRLYSLANINGVKNTGPVFTRCEEFDLQAYAARSFGVFQEDPVDVVWKIHADAAPDAREYMFHPTQKMEEQDDGSLIVRFTAGGMLEMCWELFKWGGSIEILKPQELVEEYKGLLKAM